MFDLTIWLITVVTESHERPFLISLEGPDREKSVGEALTTAEYARIRAVGKWDTTVSTRLLYLP